MCRGVGSLRLTFFVECAFLAIVLFLFAEHFVEAFRINLLILLGGHSARRGFGPHEVSDVRVFLVELLLELGDARHGSISRLASLFLYSNENRLNLVTVQDNLISESSAKKRNQISKVLDPFDADLTIF